MITKKAGVGPEAEALGRFGHGPPAGVDGDRARPCARVDAGQPAEGDDGVLADAVEAFDRGDDG